jgi:hypothetical protein
MAIERYGVHGVKVYQLNICEAMRYFQEPKCD